jgi:hypothetical protein
MGSNSFAPCLKERKKLREMDVSSQCPARQLRLHKSGLHVPLRQLENRHRDTNQRRKCRKLQPTTLTSKHSY